jgi:L-alanine-DL-glutamate epimerase-like enolase superfamily enzyme
VAQFAIAVLDQALWDLIGKAAGLPCWRIFGAAHTVMPVYNMCGWYYDNDDDLSQFRRAITAAVEEGFDAIKMKVGRGTPADDERRIRAALDLMGPSRRVMVDANQALNANEALRRGRIYQQLGCFWYEEPLPPHDMEGYALLARELDMRIATGENLYTRYAFLDLLKRGGADVIQPDNRRAGGPTEWMEIAALASAFDCELASHGGGPANLHSLLAMPAAIYMETGSLKGDSSHVEQLVLKDGAVLAPQGLGLGSELRTGWISKNRAEGTRATWRPGASRHDQRRRRVRHGRGGRRCG